MDRARQIDLLARPAATSRRGKRATTQARRSPNILTAHRCLAVVLGDGVTPPTEFRLFTAGWNDTENGRYLFDAEAATSVMAAYAKWGVDIAIDLEHQMLDGRPQPDPTARDARGSCSLELRPDGSLWAVNVKWTADGAERLTQKRQRYVSPAFGVDEATSRVTSIVNVAITSIPATHDTPALVAASANGAPMNPDQVEAALEALTSGDDAKCAEILKGIIASAAGGGEPGAEPVNDPSAEPAAELDAVPDPAEPDATDPKKNKEMMAAARMALAITGKTNPGEAMAELTRRSKVAVDLEAREAKLSSDRKTLEAGERRTLVGSLVKLGYEIPATAWSDDKGSVPCARLQAEPIAELRARVVALTAAGGTLRKAPTAPATGGEAELSAKEVAMCSATAKRTGKPVAEVTANYLATKANVAARNAPRAQES